MSEKIADVTLNFINTVYSTNSNGQIVSIPISEFHVPGFYSFVWNPISLSSGIYYIQLISDQIRISKKVVYLK